MHTAEVVYFVAATGLVAYLDVLTDSRLVYIIPLRR